MRIAKNVKLRIKDKEQFDAVIGICKADGIRVNAGCTFSTAREIYVYGTRERRQVGWMSGWIIGILITISLKKCVPQSL